MKVKTECTSCRYITAGKIYDVSGDNSGFWVVDDEGDSIFCCITGSCHLNGKDWIIVEEDK